MTLAANEHVDGVPWWKAPVPRLLHRHRAQTRGWLSYVTLVERCACGALRRDGGRWSRRERWPFSREDRSSVHLDYEEASGEILALHALAKHARDDAELFDRLVTRAEDRSSSGE